MGKVGPNPQTNDHRSFRTNMVGSEDKTTNLTDPKRTQTCVILVTCSKLLLLMSGYGYLAGYLIKGEMLTPIASQSNAILSAILSDTA